MHIVFKVLILFVYPLFSMGTQFLVLPYSSQELTLGSHASNSSLTPSNPALFSGFENKPQFYCDRGLWYGESTIAQFGCNLKSNNSVKHIGLKYSGINDLELRDEVPQNNPLSNFSSFGLSFDLGMSIAREKHKLGFLFSFIHFGIFTEESKGIGINLGYAYQLNKDFQIGFALQNLGIMSSLNSKKPTLPQRLLLGLSKKMNFNKYSNNIMSSYEWNSLNNKSKINIGNSFEWNRLKIYSGFSFTKEILEVSIGSGLMIGRYTIDYGIRIGSQGIGIPQIISLRVLLP
tara:strand:+ start:1471 stop:2337 length:867 start_codon:yes stop_codon:yes gene_type:complete